ncbi:MAG: SDR family oxidoreductase [Bilophila wadsworthia]
MPYYGIKRGQHVGFHPVLTRAIQPLEILTRKDAPMCLAEIAGRPACPKAAPIRSAAGLIMFTKCLAVEYAAEGIRANALCPGQILTDMNVKRYAREAAEDCMPEETMRRAIATVPLGRFRLHDRAGAERHRGQITEL